VRLYAILRENPWDEYKLRIRPMRIYIRKSSPLE